MPHSKTTLKKKPAAKSSSKPAARKQVVAKGRTQKATNMKVVSKKAAAQRARTTAKPDVKAKKIEAKIVKPAVKAAAAKTVAPKAKKLISKSAFKAAAKKVASKVAQAKPAAVKAAPVNPVEVAPIAAKPTLPASSFRKPIEFKTAPPPMVAPKRISAASLGFKVNEHVVYPTHGVGKVTAIEEQMIAGLSLQLFVLFFAKDKMTLRVPFGKIVSVGMRKVSDDATVKRGLETLKGRPRIKRTMWSRRAQEYEAKINSGDLIAVAEVVRDLYRADTQPEQSYSERQLFEAALDRMVREIAVVHANSDDEATHTIMGMLQKGPRRQRADAVPALTADNDDDAAEEKAA